MVYQECGDLVALNLRGTSLVENGKAYPVKSSKSVFSAGPDISIARLRQRNHRVMREAVTVLPDVMGVLGDRFGWIDGRKRHFRHAQNTQETGQEAREKF